VGSAGHLMAHGKSTLGQSSHCRRQKGGTEILGCYIRG
jgi:hypothetical protein